MKNCNCKSPLVLINREGKAICNNCGLSRKLKSERAKEMAKAMKELE